MIRAIRRFLRADSGVTMPELLVTVGIMGYVISTAYFTMNMLAYYADYVEKETVLQADTRAVLDEMTRELRQAQEIQDGGGAFESAAARRAVFYADLDHDKVPERIEYRVVQDALQKTVSHASVPVYPYNFAAGPTEVVLPDLQSSWTDPMFRYYNVSDPPTEVPFGDTDEISAVEITLVSADMAADTEIAVDLSTWVKIRAVHNTLD